MFFIFLFITILSSINVYSLSLKNDKKRRTKLIFSLSFSWIYSAIVDRLLLSMYNERVLVIITFISAIILFLSILSLIFEYDSDIDRTDHEARKWKGFYK